MKRRLLAGLSIGLLFFFLWLAWDWWRAPRGVVVDAGARNTFPCVVYDPVTFHRREPHCSGWGLRGTRKVFLRYNSMGLRDKEYPERATPGVFRILALGSSNLAGPGLKEELTPPRLLENNLRKLFPGKRIEIINAATDAFFSQQSSMKLPDYLRRYHPDLVLFHLASRNGIFLDAALAGSLRREAGVTRLERDPFRLHPWIANFYAAPEALSSGWYQGISWHEQLQRAAVSWRAAAPWVKSGAGVRYLLAPTVENLRSMQSSTEAANSRFLVIWNRSELTPDQHVPPGMSIALAHFFNRYLIHGFRFDAELSTAALRETGLPLLEIWEPRLFYRDYRLEGDFHWNERGAKLFAHEVAEALRQKL